MHSPMLTDISSQLVRKVDAQGVISSPLLRRRKEPTKDTQLVPVPLPIIPPTLQAFSPDIIKEGLTLNLIDELPDDVLAIIFAFIPLSSVSSLLRVCKRWSKCAKQHSCALWKYWFKSRDWMVKDRVKIEKDVKKRRLDWKSICHRHLEVEKGWLKGQPRSIREIKHAHDRIIISIECDDTKIVSGSLDKTIKIWDRDTVQPLKTIEHDAAVQCFQFRGNRLVSGAKDITIWNMDDGNCLYTYKSPYPCNALKFDNKELVYGDSQAIYFCDMQTGLHKKTLDENYLRALIMDDNSLISGHMFDMKGWDMRTYENTWRIPCGASTNCMQLGNYKLFSFVAGGKTLNVHDLRVMKKFATVDEDIVFGLSLDCNKLVTANPFYIKVWDASTMTERSLCLPPTKRTGYFSYVQTHWDQMICGESCSPSLLIYDF